jgi:chromosomal replication initiator protein
MSKNDVAQSIWDTALTAILTRVPQGEHAMLTKITCEGLERSGENHEETLLLRAPNDITEIWINFNHREVITEQLTLAAGRRLRYLLRPPEGRTPAPETGDGGARGLNGATPETPPASAPAPEIPRAHAPRQRSIPSANAINPSYVFDTFIVGPENDLAHSLAVAVANTPAAGYNPLFIYGPTGVGKTHLLHAIAHTTMGRTPDSRVIYVTCEAFTNEYIETVRDGSYVDFRRKYREADYLLIDDIQFLAKRERTQEEFFYTFNELRTCGRQIVLTSDRPASEIAGLEARLVSRFNSGTSVDITPPRFETRVGILRNKAEAVGLKIDPALIDYLANRIAKNARNLEGAILKLSGYQKLIVERNIRDGTPPPPLTQEKVAEILRDTIIEGVEDRITPDVIQKRVADYYRIPVTEMTAKKRTAHIAFARQVAMFLTAKLTGMSLSAIGDAFGGRDHGTVIHARTQVEARMDTTPAIKSAIAILEEQIQNPRG